MSHEQKVHNDNEACCTTAPVIHSHENYKEKGHFMPIHTWEKCYVVDVGDPKKETNRAIIITYDVFGYYPQTLQAADLLSTLTNSTVYMPDLLRGQPLAITSFPPDTPEKKAAIQEFFGKHTDWDVKSTELLDLGKWLVDAEGKEWIGVLGYCWGGKLVVYTAGLEQAEGTFDAVATVHPAMLTEEDGEKIKVPLGLFPTKEEPIDVMEKLFQAASKKPFGKKNVYKLYAEEGTFHGFAAARADLNNPANVKQYQEFYQTLAEFYKGTFVETK